MFLNINFSTVNWDLASTISSSILSVVAIVISVVAIVKTSRDNNKILEANSRPYISVYTETLIANKNHFYIIVRNFGNTNAIIQNIKVDEKTRAMIKLGKDFYFDNIIKSQLAPGQSITHVVTTLDEKYDYDHVSTFEIIYKSSQKKYSDKFEFNLSTNATMPSIGPSDGNYEKQFLELYQDEIRKKL